MGDKDIPGLVTFLRARHNERFFQPIGVLNRARGSERGYGFASLALCSLLIETIQSFREGLPTTNGGELSALRRTPNVPPQFQLPAPPAVCGREAFTRFFKQYQSHFPELCGDTYYDQVRNGLLHQAQTKGGWTIRKSCTKNVQCVADVPRRVLYRDDFAEALESSFKEYLDELSKTAWTDDLWKKAARKIWWLIHTSSPPREMPVEKRAKIDQLDRLTARKLPGPSGEA